MPFINTTFWDESLHPVLAILLFIAMVGIFWVIPIYYGSNNLKRKGYSTNWMWFGIHPLSGWIMFMISLNLHQRPRCGKCHNFAPSIKYQKCPYCGFENLIRKI